jgi:hypothetical protein
MDLLLLPLLPPLLMVAVLLHQAYIRCQQQPKAEVGI